MATKPKLEKEVEEGVDFLDQTIKSHKKGFIRLAIAGFCLLIAGLNIGNVAAGNYSQGGYGGCRYDVACNVSSAPHKLQSIENQTWGVIVKLTTSVAAVSISVFELVVLRRH